MSNHITFILLFLASTISFSQNKFEPGTIHFKNGNQENGLIEYYNKNNAEVLFKKTEDDRPKKLAANQIEYYSFENFERKIVSEKISVYKYIESNSTKNLNKKIISEVVNKQSYFLEILVEGKASLFFMKNEDNKTRRYFLKSQKSGLQELDVIIRKKENVQNNQFNVENQFKIKRYLGILSLDFKDCEAVKSKIKNVKFTQTSLSKIFIEYNNCSGTTTYVSERLKRKNKHNLVLETGINSSTIKERGTSFRGQNFENTLSPNIGIYYIFTPTILSSKISVSFGVSYTTINVEGEYHRNVDILKAQFQNTKIDLETINIRVGGIYNFNKIKRKINPNIGLYYINSRLLNSENTYLRIDADGNTSFLHDESSVSELKSTSGFALELGTNHQIYKKNDLTLKVGYEIIGDFLEHGGAFYPTHSLTLKLGYSINL